MAGIPAHARARLARPWLPPVGTVVAAGAGCLVLLLTDPGRFPVICPFRVATGLWCPVCGSTRGVHALVHGDVAAAAGYNLLLLLALPAAAYAWAAWAAPLLGGPRLPRLRLPPMVWWGLLAVGLAFGALRNLPGFAFLAP